MSHSNMSQRLEVKRIDGDIVCVIDAGLEWTGWKLKLKISDYVGICACKFRLVAGEYFLKDSLYVKRFM